MVVVSYCIGYNNRIRYNEIKYNASQTNRNILEIIKADSTFYDHLEIYFPEDYEKIVITQGSSFYTFVYFYYDNNNRLCNSDEAIYYHLIYYNVNVGSSKYTLYNYRIQSYWHSSISSVYSKLGEVGSVNKSEKR